MNANAKTRSPFLSAFPGWVMKMPRRTEADCKCQDCGKEFHIVRGDRVECPECGSQNVRLSVKHKETG